MCLLCKEETNHVYLNRNEKKVRHITGYLPFNLYHVYHNDNIENKHKAYLTISVKLLPPYIDKLLDKHYYKD